jgi:hypothetical protein
MRGKIIFLAVMITGGTALPAMAQQDSCLNEIQRLEAAFAQGNGGGVQQSGGPDGAATPNADRAQSRATNREAVSKDLERSGGVVAPPPIGSGISTDQRGAGPASVNQDQGQQPGGLAGAKLSPQQQDDMKAMLQDGRAAAERGDSRGCMDKVKQARQLARGATTGGQGTGGSGGSSAGGSSSARGGGG